MANNTFLLKRSSVAGKQPNTSTLSTGELALNLTDQKLYSSNGTAIIEPASNVTSLYVGNSSVYSTVNSTFYTGKANNSLYANNATYLNGQLASYYTNATNITTGTLPYAQIPANVVNTTANFTISGIYTHIANVSVNGAIIASGSSGTSGQVLTSNGSGNVYWAPPPSATVNVTAQYTWTNTQTFSNTITFTGTPSSINATGQINATSLTVSSNFIANTSQITIAAGVPLSVNGTVGIANQVLTSNGSTGSPYWSTLTIASAIRQQYTGDGSTTTFTVTGGYAPYNLDVYVNGVKFRNGTDVTVTSGSTFTFTTAPPNGSLIDIIGSSIPTAIVQKAGDTMTGNLTIANSSGDVSLTVSNSTSNVVITSSSIYTNGTVNAAIVNVSNTLTTYALKAGGSLGTVGQILVSNGSAINWETLPSTNELFVSKSGSDSNSGTNNKPFLTIAAAVAVATSGTTIFVDNGDYTENNPLTVPAGVAIIGNSLRGVNIIPSNTTSDVFWLNNGTYIRELTVRDYVSPAAAFAFPNGGAGTITRSPYILNCTSLTTTGIGLKIDGSKASGNKSIIAGLYTIINQDGIGVYISNQGYSQLVNIYTICTNVSIQCESGGFCSLNCSDTTFGNWGLIANGISSSVNSGNINGAQSGNTFILKNVANGTPYINGAIKFFGDTNYYTITGVTPTVANASTVNILETIPTTISDNTAFTVYQRSQITASGHTFEYCGTGTNISVASPFAGGISNTERQVLSGNGGVVNYTSTDQFGNFNIGSGLTISGPTSTIQGVTFQKSLFGLMTPYILALEGN
ncbi:Domain of unknown function DUF1565 [uncultured Caudovirales phage]|uniref:Uncharacterized protein n=1 Tax=uncultured Caudovirales phage TaxID=2100421 RepID=A0A6J5P5L3_9CAUD|nr:Domain of unknown function DUF1565 [uncultured Caudovirales phage]